ncbi:MAG: tyrosine-type recombinase/integrase [Clostridium sp.]|uniref:tyrosine-type recombinase/integrase n=1 Tax=Clostridium sp. TaxID=1506 RepID=UPI0025B96F02|nr:tyrosine-type recombinase/integrase [Clostridium sp.]MCE5220067.1 tyrosine-type recombinase/integrase [Clostridium sp.]
MITIAEISKKIKFHDPEKLKNINPETLKLYDKYKVDMTIRELSQKTIEGYDNDLSHWFIFIYDNQDNKSILKLTEDDIVEFLYFCKTQGNNSRRMKRRISSISAFYKFLRRKKLITENPLEFFERPKKDTDIITQTFLTKEQVDLMKQKLIENGDLQLQTYANFSLSTMARVNAVSNTRWDQIDFDERTVNEVLEKEGKIVTLYFSQEVKDLLLKLKQYREDNQIDDSGWVFITRYDNAFNKVAKGTMQQWAKRVGELIGVPTMHAHDFRHSGSQLMLINGAPLEEISTLLNHSGLDVTKKFYTREDKKKVQENKDKYGV